MNLRFVEAFYWAATLKSVSFAAEKLFLTPLMPLRKERVAIGDTMTADCLKTAGA